MTEPKALTQEAVEKIAGGDCTVTEIQKALEDIQNSYDTLVEFTSYVIGRVAGE